VLFVAVALAGITVLSGAVQAGIGLSVVPLIAQHLPSISGFTYILFGVGIVAVGRNPYGIGLLYTYLDEWRSARRARSGAGGEVSGSPPTSLDETAVPHPVHSVG
jgi:hypothetical protein